MMAHWARNHVFLGALLVSILFHVSMVSVFSIVARFPGSHIRYLSVALVREEAPPRFPAAGEQNPLRMSKLDEMIEQATPTKEPLRDTLPPIELSRLGAQGQTVDTPQARLAIRSQFREVFEPAAETRRDSWGAFTRGLRGIPLTLSQWTQLGEPVPAPPLMRISPDPSPVAGVALYIEWLSEPMHRKPLFLPSIPALWTMDRSGLGAGLSVSFSVNDEGEVLNVETPVKDDAGILGNVRETLLKYRFDPLAPPTGTLQQGTLWIKAEDEAP